MLKNTIDAPVACLPPGARPCMLDARSLAAAKRASSAQCSTVRNRGWWRLDQLGRRRDRRRLSCLGRGLGTTSWTGTGEGLSTLKRGPNSKRNAQQRRPRTRRPPKRSRPRRRSVRGCPREAEPNCRGASRRRRGCAVEARAPTRRHLRTAQRNRYAEIPRRDNGPEDSSNRQRGACRRQELAPIHGDTRRRLGR